MSATPLTSIPFVPSAVEAPSPHIASFNAEPVR
jgi:hypothetical protein